MNPQFAPDFKLCILTSANKQSKSNSVAAEGSLVKSVEMIIIIIVIQTMVIIIYQLKEVTISLVLIGGCRYVK